MKRTKIDTDRLHSAGLLPSGVEITVDEEDGGDWKVTVSMNNAGGEPVVVSMYSYDCGNSKKTCLSANDPQRGNVLDPDDHDIGILRVEGTWEGSAFLLALFLLVSTVLERFEAEFIEGLYYPERSVT